MADDALGRLYVAEEDRGIWRYGAEPGAGSRRTLVDRTGAGGHLGADVEGLAIPAGPRGTGHLVASSQGDDRFAVYRRGGRNAYVRSFRSGPTAGIDGVTDTDGIDVTARPLGPRFPRGLFVAQDGDNDGAHQNFKLVPWRPKGRQGTSRCEVLGEEQPRVGLLDALGVGEDRVVRRGADRDAGDAGRLTRRLVDDEPEGPAGAGEALRVAQLALVDPRCLVAGQVQARRVARADLQRAALARMPRLMVMPCLEA